MAIFHLSVKTVSRSAGRSAVAAVAYRTAERLVDQRTGELHDYRRKRGVEFTEVFLPKGAPEWAHIREALWNAAEQAENRKNSTVAREFEIALPSELSAQQRERLARDLAREIVERHGCAVDLAIHAPGKAGDNRNHHAHVLLTTRRLGPQGFAEKTRELDDRNSKEIVRWRERFAQLQNERLQECGHGARVHHRSLAAQGIKRQATRHLGPTAAAIERRTGKPSRKRLEFEREVAERLAQAKEAGELERRASRLDRSIVDLSGDLQAALRQREREQRQEQERQQAIEAVRPLSVSGMAEFRRQFELYRQAEAGKERLLREFQAEQARQAADRAERARQEILRQRELQMQLEQQRKAEKQREQQRQCPGPGWSQ